MHRGLRRSWRLLVALTMLLIAGESTGAERAAKTAGRRSPQRDRSNNDVRRENRGKLKATNARSGPTKPSDTRQAEELFGISWFTSLDRAGNAARQGKPLDEGKPIFCLRALGDLDGFM